MIRRCASLGYSGGLRGSGAGLPTFLKAQRGTLPGSIAGRRGVAAPAWLASTVVSHHCGQASPRHRRTFAFGRSPPRRAAAELCCGLFAAGTSCLWTVGVAGGLLAAGGYLYVTSLKSVGHDIDGMLKSIEAKLGVFGEETGITGAKPKHSFMLNFAVLVSAELLRKKGEEVEVAGKTVALDVEASAEDLDFVKQAYRYCRAAIAAYPAEMWVLLGLRPANLDTFAEDMTIRQKRPQEEWEERQRKMRAEYSGMQVVRADSMLSEQYVYQPYSVLMLDEQEKTVVLSIRGSATWQDAVTVLMCDSAKIWEDANWYSHEGFLTSAKAVLAKFGPEIEKLRKEKQWNRVVFTGHSLGGGVSQILGLLYQEDCISRGDACTVECFNFAPPPALSYDAGKESVASAEGGAFGDLFRNLHSGVVLRNHHFVVEDDIVSTLSMGNMIRAALALGKIDDLPWGSMQRIRYAYALASSLPVQLHQAAVERQVPRRFMLEHVPNKVEGLLRGKTEAEAYAGGQHYYRARHDPKAARDMKKEAEDSAAAAKVADASSRRKGSGAKKTEEEEEFVLPNLTELMRRRGYRLLRVHGSIAASGLCIENVECLLNHFAVFYERSLEDILGDAAR